MPDYDGRVSEACKDECQDYTCVKTMGDPYGCGSCCGCLGGCVVAYFEQQKEGDGYVKVDRCTCNAVFCGPGSGHESDCGWVEA